MKRPIAIAAMLVAVLGLAACSDSNSPTEPSRTYNVLYRVTSDQVIGFVEYDPGNGAMVSDNPNAFIFERNVAMRSGDEVLLRGSTFLQGATIVTDVVVVSSDGNGNDFTDTDTCTSLCTATVGPVALD